MDLEVVTEGVHLSRFNVLKSSFLTDLQLCFTGQLLEEAKQEFEDGQQLVQCTEPTDCAPICLGCPDCGRTFD